MDLNLKFEEECWICMGSGKDVRGKYPYDDPCPVCNGKGKSLTLEGEALMGFLRSRAAEIREILEP